MNSRRLSGQNIRQDKNSSHQQNDLIGYDHSQNKLFHVCFDSFKSIEPLVKNLVNGVPSFRAPYPEAGLREGSFRQVRGRLQPESSNFMQVDMPLGACRT